MVKSEQNLNVLPENDYNDILYIIRQREKY